MNVQTESQCTNTALIYIHLDHLRLFTRETRFFSTFDYDHMCVWQSAHDQKIYLKGTCNPIFIITQYAFFCVCKTKKRQFWKNLYKQLRLRNEPQGLILVFALMVLLLPHLRWGNKLYCCAAHTEKDVRSRSPQDTSHVKRERENRGEVGEASLVARSLCTACRAADV